MLRMIVKRVGQGCLVLLVMSALVFFGVYVIGDPIALLVPADADQQDRARAIVQLGLDKPLIVQYATFLGNAVQGDFGMSFIYRRPAMELILERFGATVELAVASLVIATAIGVPAGMLAGTWPDSLLARFATGLSVIGISLPTFWIGISFIMLFSINLGWLPPNGRGATGSVLGFQSSLFSLDGWRHLAMPAVTLALFNLSLLMRMTTAAVKKAHREDYARYAIAKGVSRNRVLCRHILPNISLTLITVLGLELGQLVAFAVVTESVFGWPGAGKLIIDSINALDRPVIVCYLVFIVFVIMLINLAVDLLYIVIDPRLRLGAAP